MEKLKKGLRWSRSNNEEDCRVGGKCNGSSSGTSEGEEGDIFHEPLNTNGHSSRKRVKLQGKALEDYIPVDLAVVPRKLRSAINKRLSQSASPPLSDSKRRQLHTLNGTQTSNGCIAERYRQNMLPPTTDKRSPYKKCATHVYISHLVRNYQNADKKQRSSLPNNQSKDKEGSSFLQTSTMTIGLRNGMIPPSSGFHIERSSLEGSSRMVQDGRLVQAHMASTLSGAYVQQKHGGEHFSISAVGDAKNSGNGLQPSGQLPVHYLQHHSHMSFPFAGGPYSSHYQDQLTAAATQQVPMQIQRPHHMITGPLYESQMVQLTGGTTTKQQQQQMWQAQLAHYGPPLGFQAKWQQNGQHPDSLQPSSSFHTGGPSIFPLPKDFHAPNGHPHFLLPRPSSSSLPSRPKQQHQQQHNGGGGFNLESSSQLQMLCNAETFR